MSDDWKGALGVAAFVLAMGIGLALIMLAGRVGGCP